MLHLLSIMAFAGKVAPTVTDCGQGKSLFSINDLAFFPDPPVANQNATLRLGFSVPPSKSIEGGTATYAIKYSFIPLTPTVEDLCTQTICPITEGSHTQESTSLFPELNGKVEMTTTWKDLSGTQLLCYKVSATV